MAATIINWGPSIHFLLIIKTQTQFMLEQKIFCFNELLDQSLCVTLYRLLSGVLFISLVAVILYPICLWNVFFFCFPPYTTPAMDIMQHRIDPTRCKQHKLHWFLQRFCHTLAGFYYMPYFRQNRLGNIGERGKLGLTFTTQRCKKPDIIYYLTGSK